jgi:N-acetylmuramoyl-L-alanine amidase
MRWIEAAVTAAVVLGSGWAQAPQSPAIPQLPPARVPVVQVRFLVVLDPAHGGSDTGARLGDGILEKNLTLELAARLRSILESRGIDAVMTRQSDVNLTPLNRAETANAAAPTACLLIHATATGSGVHLFTSSLSPAARQPFSPWATAQAAYVTQSLKLESEIDGALVHTGIPVTLGQASVAPMDNLACPEVAVELAPLVGGHVTQGKPITDAEYETSVVESVAAALEQWRSDWKPS